jgi:hypothetical protein
MEKLDLEIGHYQETIDQLSDKQFYVNSQISLISKEIVAINTNFTGSLSS